MPKIEQTLAALTAHSVPRPEYPRPQMVRSKWMNLNGDWEFEIDHGASGRERGFAEREELSGRINVPFCPESCLSGVGYTDFMAAVWYRRTFVLPEDWQGQRVLAHFGAVDYEAFVYVNGTLVGSHRGGYISFSLDITDQLQAGTNVITVCAEDAVRTSNQPAGKQSQRYGSWGCLYTRTTGIWQTVWLEAVPQISIANLKLTPDMASVALHVEAELATNGDGMELVARAVYEEQGVGEARFPVTGNLAQGTLALSQLYPWEPGQGRLYDLTLTLERDGEIVDKVDSYFGMRSVTWGEGKIYINGKPVFQRLILDQGFYPDGIYTAPADQELKDDILRSMELGFNGARLHQKIFEPRFLYWADRLGYLVWGEHASWGLDISTMEGAKHFLPEWLEELARDYNHPAIVGWCPFNETHVDQEDAVIGLTYTVTKAFDRTRPVIDTSGYVHVQTDIFDCHNYDQNPESFARSFAGLAGEGEIFMNHPDRDARAWHHQPYFVSEYGGIRWAPEQDEGWGYGDAPRTEAEFLERYRALTTALLRNPGVCAFCYTQLTDVEQEVNGLYTYERKPKFEARLIREINQQIAAIEEAPNA